VADAKKAGLWGKAGPWSLYPSRMLSLRSRGFALRNTFADALRGLITAEEAQDYPTTESRPAAVDCGRSPATAVVSKPTAQSPALSANATEDDMQRSRLAINRAKGVADLERMRDTTEQRLKLAYYTPAQADELFNLIGGKIDWLTSEPEDAGQEFAHEAAQHEVRS
jgi:hypothetical protein